MRKNLLKFLAAATLATCLFLAEAQAGAASQFRPTQDDLFEMRYDMPYLPDNTRQEKADLYIPNPTGNPKIDNNRPAMVVIHGGGFNKNTKRDAREQVTGKLLASNGVVAMSIDYLLWNNQTSMTPFPTNIQDCRNAVKYLRKNAKSLGIDPERIGIIGASAGGNLATMVAVTKRFDDHGYHGISSDVKVLVDMYGNIDLLSHRDYKLFNKTRKEDSQIYKRYSPYNYLHEDVPPTLIIHSDRDPTVSVLQSVKLHKKLKNLGVSTKFVHVESKKHDISLQKFRDIDLQKVLIAFLEEHLF